MSTTLSKLLEEVLNEALDIGSCNWDNYLEGNRWPELKDSPKYKELIFRLNVLETLL
jgi:hypothetical protein